MRAYYEAGREQGRLSAGRGELERLRTQELLARHLPPAPAIVLDVGGAAGVYAFWLATRGYDVHLLDPIPLHIEQARNVAEQSGIVLGSVSIGDARTLPQDDASVDSALLLGPLYHLTDRADRLTALREARRVLRPDGVVFIVGISRYASLFDGLSSGRLVDAEFEGIARQDLSDGQHRNPDQRPGYFTTAYFHHPGELQDEVRTAGLTIVETVGVEGPGFWMAGDFDHWWNDPRGREQVLFAARATEHEPALLGLGPHIMVVARSN